MADFTLNDLNEITVIAADDILHVRNTSGLDKKITYANLAAQFDPIGVIKMFDGSGWIDNTTIPGWYACIASNSGVGCPDLENQFIKGADPADVLDTGGSATVTLTEAQLASHTHTGASHNHSQTAHSHGIDHNHPSVSTGNHRHDIDAVSKGTSGSRVTLRELGSTHYTLRTEYSLVAVDLPNFVGDTNSTTSVDTGNKTPGAGGSAGSGSAHNNEPQYYKLIFIRKCA